MMINKEVYLLSERWRVLSGSWLKMIAMVVMAIDHVAAYILRYNPDFTVALFTMGNKQISWYFLMRSIGRLAFPLFAFLLVEGFLHTHDRMKYGRNLLVFALLSEIPYDLVRRDSLFAAGQNVFFTLFLGFLALWAVRTWEEGKYSPTRLTIMLFSLIGVGILLRSDYGGYGVSFILLLYVMRRNRILQAAIGCCFLGTRWIAGLAFIPINLYNGQRGFIQGPIGKYFFYIFYPLHLLTIYFVRRMII